MTDTFVKLIEFTENETYLDFLDRRIMYGRWIAEHNAKYSKRKDLYEIALTIKNEKTTIENYCILIYENFKQRLNEKQD